MRKKLTPEIIDRIKSEYSNGRPCNKIAQLIGITLTTLKAGLKESGVTRRPSGRVARTPGQDVAAFWSNVEVGSPYICWEWLGAKNVWGYGVCTFSGKTAASHRVAWEIANGPVPDSKHVLHRCDNPPCCNARHLFLGTHTENMEDKASKGRCSTIHGEGQKNSKLTTAKVNEIRQKRAVGATVTAIAAEYGVSKSVISEVVNGRSWKRTLTVSPTQIS